MQINEKRLVKEFIKLVKIDSESGQEQEIIQYLKKELQKLGFKTLIDKIGNLIARNSLKPKLLLAAHVDTVKPGKNIKPIIKNGIIKTDGSTILGGDDKSGVAAILEILRSLKENRVKTDLEIIFTVQEEVGLVGSSSLDFKRLKAKQAINLDGRMGEIILGEPSIVQIDIKIKGKAAHAGVSPEKGINSIAVASKAIANLKWGRIDKETTSNVGIMAGGAARNVVPELTEIQAEVRNHDSQKLKKYMDLIVKQFKKAAKEYKAKVEIKVKQASKAYRLKTSDNLIKELLKSCQKNKVKAKITIDCGVSDSNSFNKGGLRCVSAGPGGHSIHSTREFINIKEMVNGTKVIYDVVLEIAAPHLKN